MKSARLLALLLVLVLVISAGGCALIGSQPPPIPHGTGDPYGDCQNCHIRGEQGAPVTDHIKKANCQTCHKSGTQDQGGQ